MSKKSVVKPVEAEDISMEEVLGKTKKPSIYHSMLPMNLESSRIYVVVADTLIYDRKGKPASYKMETGRQMAQACHAVSALKLYYCEQHAQENDRELWSLVIRLMERPITTITLKARDSKEITHLSHLASKEGLLHFCFQDDNAAVYGTEERIPSAIAIGPIHPCQTKGITDYLPLWKDDVPHVG